MEQSEELLTLKEAATFYKVSPQFILKRTSINYTPVSARIPHLRMGNRALRFKKSDLIQWLEFATDAATMHRLAYDKQIDAELAAAKEQGQPPVV